ncbi:MAG: hypothetical protein SFY69_13295 [Planctomycetota bacterium]|nr:hypothetical protein [Planctomycetota bacterium]
MIPHRTTRFVNPLRTTALAFAPCIILVAVAIVTPVRAPSSAHAGGGTDAQAPLMLPPVRSLTDQQQQLKSLMDTTAREAFGPSPLRVRVMADEPALEPDPANTHVPNQSARPAPPDISVTSIMVAGSTPMAVVGGSLRREGDAAAPGWTVDRIDHDRGLVILVHASGATHELRLRPR